MKKILYIIGICLVFIFIFIFYSNTKINASTLVNEEASPIREGDKIIGMDYVITIGEGVKKDNVYISTSILSSIIHYKNIEDIDSFNIDLKINNNSNYSYSLKNIFIISGNSSKDINFKNKGGYIYFKLNKEDLLNYSSNSYIQIKLQK